MVPILKLMFFLIILQLTLASTVYSKTIDGIINDGSEDTSTSVGTINNGNEESEDTSTYVGTINDGNEESDDTSTYVGTDENDATQANNQVVVNENTLRAVSGEVTPDASCDDATLNMPYIDASMGLDATVIYDNVIAMVPEAVWNQDAVKNCQASMTVYCLPSVLGDCKYPDLLRNSVPVSIVGSTGPDGAPNEYILHESPFSAIAAQGASVVAISVF